MNSNEYERDEREERKNERFEKFIIPCESVLIER
jgi:hypothetical protein